MESSSSMGKEGEDWELRHDEDGFTYKILTSNKMAEAVQPPVTDRKAEERCRKLRKKNILIKLKSQYQKEIVQWELLSSTLLSMQDRANRQLQMQKEHQNLGHTALISLESSSMPPQGKEKTYGSLVDELLLQAEAQEAVINDMTYLCDVAESMCNAEQESLAQSYINLPIWSSPRKLMAGLRDDE
ncbi:uncharacterized protein LOC126671436 [Mercurialis annua]|uniref:uncharacterized protein LOC126671436 n=1 Tax=Mercurialis annua TaxID=3986 RepID=UPI002160CE44|nr:uncharacterized protein LOC126671436 [Mercurialis annua]